MSSTETIQESIQNVAGIAPAIAKRGALVFAAGMALAAASFIVESVIIKAVKARS
jgi:hypothetical protein